MTAAIGTVLYGINRIYTIETDAGLLEARLKGKTLAGFARQYNPLAPGDRVELTLVGPGQGLIVGRLPRRNKFWRWNRKGRAVQTLAANLAGVVCVASPSSPPFRPRFVDRILVIANHESIPVVVVLNKIDTGVPEAAADRLAYFERIGVRVLHCSAHTEIGVEELRRLATPGPVALVGQSGVGKSSLVNALDAGLDLRTGTVSQKYNRGTHVTNFGRMIRIGSASIVDTPGIREIDLYGLSQEQIAEGFGEFASIECDFPGCTHVHEPGCGVAKAVEDGAIHPDRYESYLRILADLELSERLAR